MSSGCPGPAPACKRKSGDARRPGVIQEHAHQLRGKQLMEQYAHRRNDEPDRERHADYISQAPAVTGRVVVADQRHHALAYSHPGVEGETLHLQHYANCGERRVVVGDHELVQNDVIEVEEEAGDRRRQPHGEYCEYALTGGHAHAGAEGDDRALPAHVQYDEEVHTGDAV